MSAETNGKRFGTQINGYNKDDVNEYIDSMVETFKNKIGEKEALISELRQKCDELGVEVEETKLQLEVSNHMASSQGDKPDDETSEIAKQAQAAAERELADLKEGYNLLSGQNDELREVNEKLVTEVHALKAGVENAPQNSNDLSSFKEELLKERDKIAQALIKAEETASTMVEEAKEQAEKVASEAEKEFEKERKSVEKLIEAEREKIVDIKRDMRELSSTFTVLLQKYESEVEEVLESRNKK